MATDWFYGRDGHQKGPVSGAELKYLASNGELRPDDLVWKEGMADWKSAGTIKGLFAVSHPSSPPLVAQNKLQANDKVRKGKDGKVVSAGKLKGLFRNPDESDQSVTNGIDDNSPAGEGATFIPTANLGILDRAKALAKNLAVLATKQASIQKLSFVDLPAADHATGSKAFTHNLGKEQFASTYDEIAQIDVQVAELRRTEETDSTATVTDRLKRAGRATAKFAKVEKLLSQRKRLVTTLGSQLRISTTCNSDGVLDQELERAKIAEQSIEKLNEEVQALGKKKSLFGTTRMVAAIVVVCVLLVIGGWMKGKLFRSDTGNARNAKITTVGTSVSESLAKIDAEREKIKLETEGIKRQLENENVEASKRAELERTQEELDIQQARLERERANREREGIRAKEDATRELESTLREEDEQKSRREFADRCFGEISFDPAKFVILSDSLRNSGATVELRGRDYTTLKRLHEAKDWIGLIEFLSPTDHLPNDSYPSPDIIVSALSIMANDGMDLFVLVKTDQKFYFDPNKPRLRFLTTSIDCYGCSDRHPDGIGYLGRWRPTDGTIVFYVARNEDDDQYPTRLKNELSEFRRNLEEKERLGEIDKKTMEIRYVAEMERIYNDALIWAKRH